jgi:hypothetical protein
MKDMWNDNKNNPCVGIAIMTILCAAITVAAFVVTTFFA